MATRLQIEPDRRSGYLGLLGLILGLAVGGVTLYAVAGPPRLPAELPGWETVLLALRGSYLPPEALAYPLTTAAWGVWLWLVGSILLRTTAAVAEALTRGAPWARALRRLSDLVTPPLVRRLVDAALVAVIVVNLVGRSAPVAAADLHTLASPVATLASAASPVPQLQPWQAGQPIAQGTVQYTVRPGDTLWAIAERFYGTGHEFGPWWRPTWAATWMTGGALPGGRDPPGRPGAHRRLPGADRVRVAELRR